MQLQLQSRGTGFGRIGGFAGSDSAAEQIAKLQLQRQTLQNEKVFFRATTPDGAGLPTEEVQKALDDQLKEVSAQLRAAKTDPVKAAEGTSDAAQSLRPMTDRYEPGTAVTASPGLYQQLGGQILFLPYSEG